jgi:hypothetical protein
MEYKHAIKAENKALSINPRNEYALSNQGIAFTHGSGYFSLQTSQYIGYQKYMRFAAISR